MKNQRGFTLVETMVTIFILVIITGLVFGSIAFLYQTQSFAWQQSVAVDEARRGIKTMVREIREARTGDDGSYPIEKADDKEFIFYADIDKDGATERVRYYIGTAGSGAQSQECVVLTTGGSCNVIFSDFFEGDLISAQIKVSTEGDFGWNNKEFAEISADGIYLNSICRTGCTDCPGVWQGDVIFDITNQASDNYLDILADADNDVDNLCNWVEPNHAMKTKVELTWEEDNPALGHYFMKGVTDPVDNSYSEENEVVTVVSAYVRNAPPIFEYYDINGGLITEYPARLSDTKLMKLHLIVNVNPDRAPDDLELKSYVQLRNLR